MASWRDFETAAPDMAAVARMLWPGITAAHLDPLRERDLPWFPIAFLATVRADGGPRLHPFCPILADGRLFAAIPAASPKGHDLRRDPRCAIHALPGPDDAELSIRARATVVGHDRAVRALVTTAVTPSGVGGMIEMTSTDPLFEFDICRVDVARWLDIGQRGTRAVRQTWRAPVQSVSSQAGLIMTAYLAGADVTAEPDLAARSSPVCECGRRTAR
jgi:hypothetical protein